MNISQRRNEFIMIDRISSDISLEGFQKLHLLPNRPCILSAEFTKSWNSRRDWVDENGMPNFTYLAENFGKMFYPINYPQGDNDVHLNRAGCHQVTHNAKFFSKVIVLSLTNLKNVYGREDAHLAIFGIQ